MNLLVELNIVSYIEILACSVYLYLGVEVLRRNVKDVANMSVALLLLAFAFWSGGIAFCRIPTVSKETAQTFLNISSIGWVTFSPLFLWFSTEFTRRKKLSRSPFFHFLLFGIAAIFLVAQWQGEMMSKLDLKQYGWLTTWKDGFWPPLFYGYYLSNLVIGLGLIIAFSIKVKDPRKVKQCRIFLITIPVAMLSGTLSNVILLELGIDEFPPLASVTSLVWAYGMVYGMVKYQFLSITPRVASEEILANLSDFLVLVDTGRTIVRVNPYTTENLGFSETELVGKPIGWLLHGDEDVHKRLNNCFHESEALGAEFDLRCHDGQKVPISLAISEVKTKSGIVTGYVCIGRDITVAKATREVLEARVRERTKELTSANRRLESEILERQKAEEQLRQSEKMRAIGQLAGGIAHDFNNMLGGIVGFAGLIQRKFGKDSPKLERYALRIQETAQRAADLNVQLLAFARKGKFKRAPVDMHAVADDALNIVSRAIDKRIVIERVYTACSAIVMGDRSQLQNIVLNLAVNARDAMPAGGTLRVATRIDHILPNDDTVASQSIEPGEFIVVAIGDSGTGMDEETQSRIFEPFFTTKESGKGTGLGLASVYGATHNHGGFVKVESIPGEGSKFEVYLPSIGMSAAKEKQTVPKDAKTGCGKILVVDDNSEVRETAAEMIEELGYTAISCCDGLAGVERYTQQHKEIDLVLLDLNMPNLNGQDCFEKLKAIDPSVRVILASGYGADGDAQKVLDSGALALLEKPFSFESLAESLQKAIDSNIS